MFEAILLLSKEMNTGMLKGMGFLNRDMKSWAASKFCPGLL